MTDQLKIKATEHITCGYIDTRAFVGTTDTLYWPPRIETRVIRSLGELSAEAWCWNPDFHSIHRVPE